WRQDDAHFRQRPDDGRRNGRNRVVQVLAQILLRYRQGGEIREPAGKGNHIAPKARGEFCHRHFRLCWIDWHFRWFDSSFDCSLDCSFDCNLDWEHGGGRLNLKGMRRILVSAGEASGDFYASLVVEELRRLMPETEFYGCTGPGLRKAGVRTVVDAASLAVVGLLEVVAHIPRIHGEYRKLLAAA